MESSTWRVQITCSPEWDALALRAAQRMLTKGEVERANGFIVDFEDDVGAVQVSFDVCMSRAGTILVKQLRSQTDE